jgi:hypothetical protein
MMMNDVLYNQGWRQGTVFQLELGFSFIAYDKDGPKLRKDVHGLWVVVTQDCNLNRAKVSTNTPTIELRQVLKDQPPVSFGIHARKFLLNSKSGHYLVDDKPCNFASPKTLSNVAETAIEYTLSDKRVIALKTWLGNRYDRPAVPPELVDLAKAIAAEAQRDGLKIEHQVRDVYMEFNVEPGNVFYSLYAVTTDDADSSTIRKWLAGVSLRVPHSLGIPRTIEALRSDEVSLALIESCYCADLSQLTWEHKEDVDEA